jgi:hypothetical protein
MELKKIDGHRHVTFPQVEAAASKLDPVKQPR